MATPKNTKPRYKKLIIILASVCIIAGAAYGTVYLLRHFAPVKVNDTANDTAADDAASIQKASELFAKGDYQAAKVEYQEVLDTYKSQNNAAGVADIEMQLRVIEATANAEHPPENTNESGSGSGGQTE